MKKKITKTQKIELDRRLKKLAEGKTKFYTWEEIKKSLREI